MKGNELQYTKLRRFVRYFFPYNKSGITLSRTNSCSMFQSYKSFENTMGKGEIMGKGKIARNEQFLLFPQCF